MRQKLLFTFLCFLSVVAAYPQTGGVKVSVPFAFVVGGNTLSAGEYVVSSVRDLVLLRDSRGRPVGTILANRISREGGKTGHVVFECYAERCFLSELWTPDPAGGRQVLKSKLEIELAKREAGKDFALLGSTPK